MLLMGPFQGAYSNIDVRKIESWKKKDLEYGLAKVAEKDSSEIFWKSENLIVFVTASKDFVRFKER